LPPIVYRPSSAQETIVILRPFNTTTTIAAFGSADGFTTPGTEFGDDEEVMVAGDVVAGNNADLTGVNMEIRVNGTFVGSVALYGYDGVRNYYQFSLGTLVEGTYTVEAAFPRTRR
jgi:hypothetical protein